MSEQQHNGRPVVAPAETGATVPPHPVLYDTVHDQMRPIAQEDYDAAARVAEEGQLRNLLIRKLLNMDRDRLRRLVRKLVDDNFPPAR